MENNKDQKIQQVSKPASETKPKVKKTDTEKLKYYKDKIAKKYECVLESEDART